MATDKKIPVSRAITGVLIILLVALLMKNSQLAVEYINRGLLLCVRTMIPSLFPFMVAAELLVHSGGGEALARWLGRWLSALFGLSECGAVAWLLGMLCGFPVGARTAACYDRDGKLTRREFNWLLSCGNIPGSAFLVSAVGGSLFGDARIGWCFLGLAVGATVLVGLLYRVLLPRGGEWQKTAPFADATCGGRHELGFGLVSESVAAAADGMLGICGTVVLFGALTGAWTALADALSLPPVVRTLSFGFFELTTGVSEASTVTRTETALILCAAMIGWAGLSVHCQILSFARENRAAVGWFWLSRALQSALCAGGMWLLIRTGCLAGTGTIRPTEWERAVLLPAARDGLPMWERAALVGGAVLIVLWRMRKAIRAHGAGRLLEGRREP